MSKRILPFIVLAIWALSAVRLIPLPDWPGSSDSLNSSQDHGSQHTDGAAINASTGSDFRPELEVWLNGASYTTMGIAAGVMGLLGIGGWRVMAIVLGAFHVALHWASVVRSPVAESLQYFPTESMLLSGMQAKIRYIEFLIFSPNFSGLFKATVVYADLIMPTLQCVVVVSLLISWLPFSRGRTE